MVLNYHCLTLCVEASSQAARQVVQTSRCILSFHFQDDWRLEIRAREVSTPDFTPYSAGRQCGHLQWGSCTLLLSSEGSGSPLSFHCQSGGNQSCSAATKLATNSPLLQDKDKAFHCALCRFHRSAHGHSILLHSTQYLQENRRAERKQIQEK